MASFCEVPFGNKKSVSPVQEMRDFVAYDRVRDERSIRNEIDRINTIIPGSYDVLEKAGINQIKRGNYSRYLESIGVSNIVFSKPIKEFSVTGDIASRVFNSGNDANIYSSIGDGEAIGVKVTNPLEVTDTNPSSAINIYVAEAINNGNDAVVIHRQDDDIVIPLKSETVKLGTEDDINGFNEFIKSQDDSSYMDEDLLKDMQSKITMEKKESLPNDQRIAIDFANELSQKLGVDYQIVTLEEAIKLTEGAYNAIKPDSNRPAFNLNGRIYFIKGKLNSKSVFHEFSHPVIRAIRNNNRELFDSLFERLSNTSEGQDIIKHLYDDEFLSNPDNIDFLKEEAIVIALSAINEDTMSDTEGVLNTIMYYIKRFLRSVFGKTINISDLKPSTSLYELAAILNDGGEISVDLGEIKTDNVVMYDMVNIDANRDDVDAYNNIGYDKCIDAINAVNQSMTRILTTMQENSDFATIAKVIGEDNVEELRKLTTGYNEEGSRKRSDALKKLERFKNSYDKEKESAVTFVKMIYGIDSIMDDLLKALNKIEKSKDYQTSTRNAYYAKHMLDSWRGFINECADACTDDSPLATKLYGMTRKLSKCDKIIKEHFENNCRSFVAEQLWQMKQFVDDYYKKKIERAKEKGGSKLDIYLEHEFIKLTGMPRDEYDEFLELYKLYKDGSLKKDSTGYSRFGTLLQKYQRGYEITDMKIDLVASGLMGDAKWLNSVVESYTSNQNLIAMSLANYIEQTYGEALNKAQDALHADYMATEQLIKDAGLKDSDGSIRKKLCFLDKKLVYDYSKYDDELKKLKDSIKDLSEDEQNHRIAEWKRNYKPGLVEKDVWTFLNPFKGYSVEFDKSLNRLNDALAEFRKHNNDKTYNDYINAKLEHQKFIRTYFNQKYKPEFYEIDDEFSEAVEYDEKGVSHRIGAIAISEYNDLLDQINTLNDIQLSGTADVSLEIENLWRKAREMSYEVNSDGTQKTGIELAKAKVLKKYKERKNSFYDSTFNLNRFTQAFNEFVDDLSSQYQKGSKEYEDRLWEWVKENTVECPKEEYFTRRQQILDEISNILGKYKKQDVVVEQEIQSCWKYINEITRNHRDDTGVIDPRSMSKSELDKLMKYEDRIEELRDKSSVKLSKDDKSRINELRQELREMQEKNYSQHYIEDFANVIASMNEHAKSLLPEFIQNQELSEENIRAFLSARWYKTVKEVMNASKAFKDFMESHHILTTVEKSGKKGTYNSNYWKVRYAYTYSYVNDEYMKEDKNIEALTGYRYRVPSYKWYDKSVKQQYITRLDVGNTVDNRGNFLPLSHDEMVKKQSRYDKIHGVGSFERQTINGEQVSVTKFYNEKYYELMRKDPKAFKLLEALVKIHLTRQQDLDSGSKLYMEVARLRKVLYQGITEGNTIETIMMKIRQAIKIDETDVYDAAVNFRKTSSTCRSNWITGDAPQEPIMGLFDIDAQDCEQSIIFANEQYYDDVFRHKAMVQMNPIVRAIQNLVNETQIMNTSKVTVTNSGNAEFEKYTRGRKGKQEILKDLINALIAREFDGQFRLDNWNGKFEQIYIASYRWLTKRASGAYFNVDFQSGLKNFLGQKIQSFIEASGSVGFNLNNFFAAESPATEVMKEMATTGYTNPVNSLHYQMVKYFDMIPGRTREKFAKEAARSIGREAISGENGTRLRKLIEMQATMQIGFAMLMNKKIRYKDSSGEHEISYSDAFEVINGNMRLKDGIDKRYDVNPFEVNVTENTTEESILQSMNIPLEDKDTVFQNIDLESVKREYIDLKQQMNEKIAETQNDEYLQDDKKQSMIDDIKSKYNKLISDRCTININNWFFKKMRSSITETFEQLNGAYKDYSQPQMNQYLLVKGYMFLRKYYISMFAHKYAFRDIFREAGRTFMVPRFNVRKQDIEMPVYGEAFNLLYETIIYGGQNLDWMTESQRGNMIRFVTELVVVGALIPLLSSLVMFGIDGDDKDKYQSQADKNKLIASWSGTMFDKNFNFGGHNRQAAVLQLLKLQDEQSQFHPFLKGITGMYNFGLKSNLVFTSVTIDNWLKSLKSLVGIFKDDINGIDKENSAFYYTRDTGPYPWQKKGSPKFINYYMKSWGLNGSNIDPATSYKNFISYMGR